jgi:hypothetical protein
MYSKGRGEGAREGRGDEGTSTQRNGREGAREGTREETSTRRARDLGMTKEGRERRR